MLTFSTFSIIPTSLGLLAMGILWSLKAVKPHVNWIHIQIVYHLSIAYSYYSKIISSQVELIISLIMDTSKCYCISWLAGWSMMWYICWLFFFWLFLFCVCLCFVLLSACNLYWLCVHSNSTNRTVDAVQPKMNITHWSGDHI
jgi:hypothetical protein